MTIEQRQTYTSVEMGGWTAGVEECRNGRVGMYRSERLRAICCAIPFILAIPISITGRFIVSDGIRPIMNPNVSLRDRCRQRKDWTGLDWDACELASG